jgi:hypothetical protein
MIKQQVLKNRAATNLESEMQQVEVLRDDWVSWSREVQGERVLDRAEVVELKDKILEGMVVSTILHNETTGVRPWGDGPCPSR